MALAWWPTVLADRNSRRAMAALERLSASNARIWSSRVVRPAGFARVARFAPRLSPLHALRLQLLAQRCAPWAVHPALRRFPALAGDAPHRGCPQAPWPPRNGSRDWPRHLPRRGSHHRYASGTARAPVPRSPSRPGTPEPERRSPCIHTFSPRIAASSPYRASRAPPSSRPASHASSARPAATTAMRWGSCVSTASAWASASSASAPPSPRRASTRPSTASAGNRCARAVPGRLSRSSASFMASSMRPVRSVARARNARM